MTRDIDISSPRADAFAPTDRSDPSYPKSLVDYCFQEFLVRDGQLLQVYEELLNIAYWIRGFAPHNVLEVGTRGSTCCRGLPRAKRWRWTYATCAQSFTISCLVMSGVSFKETLKRLRCSKPSAPIVIGLT